MEAHQALYQVTTVGVGFVGSAVWGAWLAKDEVQALPTGASLGEVLLASVLTLVAGLTRVSLQGRLSLTWLQQAHSSTPDAEPTTVPRSKAAGLLEAARLGEAAQCVELADFAGRRELLERDEEGRTALHHAALHGLASVCAALLRRSSEGVRIGDADHDGSTALHLAASEGRVAACLALLAEASPDEVDAKDADGNTALHVAAWKGHAAVCAALLDHPRFCGAGSKDKAGCTALHWAAKFGHADCCRAILMAPAFQEANARTWKQPKKTEGEGCTALHLAAMEGHAEACAALLDHPAFSALHATDYSGLTAQDLADEADYHEVLALFAAHPRFAA